MGNFLGIHDFIFFVVTGLLLNLTPGPDMLYIIARSTAMGRRAGTAAALGIGAGCLVHITTAMLGLSALLTASAAAFILVKLVGAVYLAYIGISLLLAHKSSQTLVSSPELQHVTIRTVFLQGFFTNVLNPKVALFFLAFVPQFINLHTPHKALAFLFLGVFFNCNGTLVNLIVAWCAAGTGAVVRDSKLAHWLNRCIGGFFIYLGIRLAFDESA